MALNNSGEEGPLRAALREILENPEKRQERKQKRIDDFNAQPGQLTDYDCQKCANKGFVLADISDGHDIIKTCACMIVRNNYARIRKSGLTPLMADMRFDTFEADSAPLKSFKANAMEFVVQYGTVCTGAPRAESKKWFFVGGRVGSGKTHICTAILNELMTRGIHGLFMPWRETTVELKAVVNDRESYAAIMNPLKTVAVLYIDDFLKAGFDGITKADLNIAIELIDARYTNRELVTLISGEHMINAIHNIEASVGSRIEQRCSGFCFNTTPERFQDYRLKEIITY